MIEFKHLTNSEILIKTKNLAGEERRITTEILHCLREVESRMIYAELAYSSLYDFCVNHLHYSEGSAYRRIAAMRVLKDIPIEKRESIENKVSEGSISITNLSLLHSFLKTEKRELKKNYSTEHKISLIEGLEYQSKRETERKLAAIQPKIIPSDFERVITDSITEIRFAADDELLKKLTRIREVISHTHPQASYAELINKIADEFLIRKDPILKLKTTAVKEVTPN